MAFVNSVMNGRVP